ncbi:MAG: four helix bundle protein [Saprospiraceae bacterium]
MSLNFVEGSSGQASKKFARFLHIASRSGIEVVGCINLAFRRKYISDTEHKYLSKK